MNITFELVPEDRQRLAHGWVKCGDRRRADPAHRDGAGRSGSSDGARLATDARWPHDSIALCSVLFPHLCRNGDPSTPCLAPLAIRWGSKRVAARLVPGT